MGCSLKIWMSQFNSMQVVIPLKRGEQTCRRELLKSLIKCSFLKIYVVIDASCTRLPRVSCREYRGSKAGDVNLCINNNFWLSYKEHTVDALASKGDEGRDNLR
jgi:hypothetical protein